MRKLLIFVTAIDEINGFLALCVINVRAEYDKQLYCTVTPQESRNNCSYEVRGLSL